MIREKGGAKFNFLLLILLIILIVLFNKELYILGLRIYAAATGKPEADFHLANYYRMVAKQNADNADIFYRKALNKYLDNIAKAEEASDKAKQNLAIGRIFECGRGTQQNLEKAKQYYQSAEIAAKDSAEPAVEAEIQKALRRIDTEIKELPKQPVCAQEDDKVFFVNIFAFPTFPSSNDGGSSGNTNKNSNGNNVNNGSNDNNRNDDGNGNRNKNYKN